MEKFKTYTENGKSFIERLVFPRFKAEITFNPDGVSDLENVEMIDECTDISELSKAMQKAGEYLTKGHLKK
ncbi:hypothetical protein D0T49_04200 [Paludibacter sp. 221]|nr:hypothetical protein [Paludibacter sp. 221]